MTDRDKRLLTHVEHPDDDHYFDEISIRLAERWKESELSGDEWRFTAIAEVMRKGKVIVTLSASRLEWLLDGLKWNLLIAGENGKLDMEALASTKDLCDQPSCKEEPTVFYRRLRRYTKQGDLLAPSEYSDGKEYRQFCTKHKHRGDCALDDAEHNYEEIPDPRKG